MQRYFPRFGLVSRVATIDKINVHISSSKERRNVNHPFAYVEDLDFRYGKTLFLDKDDILYLDENGNSIQIVPLEKTYKKRLMFYVLEQRLRNGAKYPGGFDQGHETMYRNLERDFLEVFPEQKEAVNEIYREYRHRIVASEMAERRKEITRRRREMDRKEFIVSKRLKIFEELEEEIRK